MPDEVRAEKRSPGLGQDHPAQLLVADVLVAGEVDPPDLDLAVLVHAEVHVDLARAVAAELVLDLRHVEAALQVQLADLLDVLLELGQVEDLLLLEIEHLVDLGQADLVVAGDVDLADGRLLLEHEGDHQAALGLGGLDLDVLEVAQPPDGAHVLLQDILAEHHARP